MRIVLSGGGTAGHINPALALAETLEEQGHEVFYAGTPQGVEARLVKEAGLPFQAFEASGFDRAHPLTLPKALRTIQKSTKRAKEWFGEIKPDVVVAFGGYVCIPVSRAAEALGIPLVIHEQNSVMGMANAYLSKGAARVALTYEVAGEQVADKSKIVVTGNPVRKSIFASTREAGRAYLGIPEDALMLLVFGGSLGARHLNSAIASLKDRLLALDDLYIMHVTGPKELETVEAALDLSEEERARYQVLGYQDHMGEAMAACDMVVSCRRCHFAGRDLCAPYPGAARAVPLRNSGPSDYQREGLCRARRGLDDRGCGRGIGRIRYVGVRSYRQRTTARFHARGGSDL